MPDNFLIKFPNEPEKHFRNTSNNTSEKRKFFGKIKKLFLFFSSHNHVLFNTTTNGIKKRKCCKKRKMMCGKYQQKRKNKKKKTKSKALFNIKDVMGGFIFIFSWCLDLKHSSAHNNLFYILLYCFSFNFSFFSPFLAMLIKQNTLFLLFVSNDSTFMYLFVGKSGKIISIKKVYVYLLYIARNGNFY